MSAERAWSDTPLADYFDIGLELESVSVSPLPHSSRRYGSGELSDAEPDHAISTYWNMVEEVTMVMRKVRYDD
jgi:hypothetical protein